MPDLVKENPGRRHLLAEEINEALSLSGGSTAVGGETGKNGEKNTLVGNQAGTQVTTGKEDTCVGAKAGGEITTGSANTFVGTAAGKVTTTGKENTYVGNSAGNETTGSGNVFVGNSAGETKTSTSNTLIVANNATTAIIEGVMSATAASQELGFFGTAPHAKPEVTGATVTAKQLAEALALIGLVKVN